MELSTRVNITPLANKLTYNNRMLIIGSCFANEIGGLLQSAGFDISVNPFGTLYNPVSIVQSLKRLAAREAFTANDVIDISLHSTQPALLQNTDTADGNSSSRFCSFYHHSSFATPSPDSFLEMANRELFAQAECFAYADTIIVTLGTSWLFKHIERNFVVSNCHKINPKEFVREFLPLDECVAMLGSLVERFPQKRFIFTVSPIRHLKDGAHGNQISKATLLLAVEHLLQKFPDNTYYFPAYEIVLDELRDYRFYAEDMVHPSGVAVKYIFERFKESCIATTEHNRIAATLKLAKQTAHRPIS